MSDLNLAPITFDNTSNQIYANIANTYKEDTLYKRKLIQDEIKNRNEIQSNLVPGLDKLGWSNEMKAQNYANIVKQATNYFRENKGKTSADLQNWLNNQIGSFTQQDQAIKQVYANVDKQVADLDPKSVNKDQVRHALLQNKLYDPATGALKTEISQEPEDLDKLLNDNPAFYKIDNAQEQLGKMLKDNQYEVGDSSIKYLKDGKRVTSYKQNNTYNKAIQVIDMDPKSPTHGDPIIKRDTDGLLDNKGFDILMSNPNVRASSVLQAKEFRKHYNEANPEQRAIMLNSGALSGEDDVDGIIKKYGGLGNKLEDNPEVDRQIQRAFMTNHLVKTFGSKHGEAESKIINQPPSTNMNIYNGQSAIDNWTPLNAKFDNPETKYVKWHGKPMGLPLNSTDQETQTLAIKAAEEFRPKPKGRQWLNSELVLKRESDGNIGVYPYNAKTGVLGVMISTMSRNNVNLAGNRQLSTKDREASIKPNTQQTGASGL